MTSTLQRVVAVFPAALSLCLAGATLDSCASAGPSVEPNDAAEDILAAIGIVQRNYAGYPDKLARYGPAIRSAERQARSVAANGPSDDDAEAALRAYLEAFQDGHVSLRRIDLRPDEAPGASSSEAGAGASMDPRVPSFGRLNDGTPLIRIHSFKSRYRSALEDILTEHDVELRAAELIVIDVRGNSGGSDSTYARLSPMLYTHPIRGAGSEVRATLENATAWEDLLPYLLDSDVATRQRVQAMADAMRDNPGGFLRYSEPSETVIAGAWEHGPPLVIVHDERTASSGEAFLLEARQSDKVTLLGQNTSGVLDYANVRRFALPSGRRRLGLATTRSGRLPAHGIDNVGIAPDVRVPRRILHDDEELQRFLVEYVRRR